MEDANFREVTRVVREGVNLTLVGFEVEDGRRRTVDASGKILPMQILI